MGSRPCIGCGIVESHFSSDLSCSVIPCPSRATSSKDTMPSHPSSPEYDSDPSRKGACRLRIIAINDVYELENLPRLRTFVVAYSEGFPKGNVFTTLAGDFLAPSLLSSLDAGHGMVQVLNKVPVQIVCFRNHESDVPYSALKSRIEEFEGVWLNSNMPDFEPALPTEHIVELTGDNGTPGARVVAFMGFCIGGGNFKATYRPDAFGGAASSIVPVLEAAEKACEQLRESQPYIDEVIPLTHQAMLEDVLLANLDLFPVIVGGHDHDVFNEVHGSRRCPVVKAGMNATNAAVIDLLWSSDADRRPEVIVNIKELSLFDPDPELVSMIDAINRPVRELDSVILYEITQGVLTSEGVRFGEVSMARKLMTWLRECLKCDAALINSGGLQGNKTYHDSISFGDLKRECPFESPIVVARMPFQIIRDAVRESRRDWWDVFEGKEPRESRSALQVDDGVNVDVNHNPITICSSDPDPDLIYSVACDCTVLRKNPILRRYCQEFPDRIPPEDAGRPLLALLMAYSLGQIWVHLCNAAISSLHEPEDTDMVACFFHMFDRKRDGYIDADELEEAIRSVLSQRIASNTVVNQLISMFDMDGDSKVSKREMERGLWRTLGYDMEDDDLTVGWVSSMRSMRSGHRVGSCEI